MNLFCKLFGHKYHYYKTIMNGPSKVFRICSRCMELEDYRNGVPILGSAWFTLVQYNRKNKQLIKKLEKGELV